MKICPVCSARCFDDMDVCYGCLHTFTNQDVGTKPNGLAYDGEEKTGVEFEGFDPEPVSERAVQQAVSESRTYELNEPNDLLERMDKKSFAAHIEIDRTADGFINVSIRLPSEAMRMLQCG